MGYIEALTGHKAAQENVPFLVDGLVYGHQHSLALTSSSFGLNILRVNVSVELMVSYKELEQTQ